MGISIGGAEISGVSLGGTDVIEISLGDVPVWTLYDPLSDPYNAAIVADSPITYWPLDDRTSGKAAELINGWNGSYIGGATVGGMLTPDGNPVAAFNGSNGYVTIPNTGNRLQPTLEFSLELWFKITAYDAYDSPWGFSKNNWDIRMNPSGGGSHEATNHWYGVGGGWGASGFSLNAPSGQEFTDGEWHHVVITRSTTNGYIDHYYDGVDAGGGSVTVEAPRDMSGQTLGLAQSRGRNLGGSVCRVAHYDRILTAGEVSDHYRLVYPELIYPGRLPATLPMILAH